MLKIIEEKSVFSTMRFQLYTNSFQQKFKGPKYLSRIIMGANHIILQKNAPSGYPVKMTNPLYERKPFAKLLRYFKRIFQYSKIMISNMEA
jgi:hypothetical protein